MQFNNKNCSRAVQNAAYPRRDGKNRESDSKNTAWKLRADRECTVCLYKQNTGISGNPIRQRRANYRESPFSHSRLLFGSAILRQQLFLRLPDASSGMIQPRLRLYKCQRVKSWRLSRFDKSRLPSRWQLVDSGRSTDFRANFNAIKYLRAS